ncbi:hypothetical protein T484DRAFT_1757319 [Baffinella frigidus]|nr:hypothetical protein T484DRAFT_1757319 [Cryptophyta sp. CCMP2293]
MNDYRRIIFPDNVDDVAKIKMEPVDDDVIDADSKKVINKAVDKQTIINVITQPNKPMANKKASMTTYNEANRVKINKQISKNYVKNKEVISVKTNLRYLNNNEDSKPTKKSIERYQLYEENGV